MITPERRVAVSLSVVLLLLTLAVTALPYLTLRSYFPMTRDIQHPMAAQYLIDHGRPLEFPAETEEFYPNTFAYLVGAFTLVTGLDVLTSLKLVGTMLMGASALAIYVFSKRLFGQYVALFAVLVYGVFSFQPRQTFDDGTLIEVLASYGLLPLFLAAMFEVVVAPRKRTALLTGLLGGALIRFHFVATTVAIGVASSFVVMTLSIHRRLVTKQLVANLAVAALIAGIVGAPYTWRYAEVYWSIALGRLGLLPPSPHEAQFPPVAFPGEVIAKLGQVYCALAVLSVAFFILKEVVARVPSPSALMLTLWLVVTVLGTVVSLPVPPERFVRAFALPASVAVAFAFHELRGYKTILSGALIVGMVLCLPSVVDAHLRTAETSQYADSVDVPSLVFAGELVKQRDGVRILGDDSGVWLPYYAGEAALVFPGGPETFAWFGEPLRSQYSSVFEAMQDPCREDSVSTLLAQNVRYIYLGRRPRHWTPPGYVYNDGAKLLGCGRYRLIYSEQTTDGPIYVFELLDNR